MRVKFLLKDDRNDLFLQKIEEDTVHPGDVMLVTAFVRSASATMPSKLTAITFIAQIDSNVESTVFYESVFISSKQD